jgi:hypothetical protein
MDSSITLQEKGNLPQEPRVYGDTVTTNTRPGWEDVYSRMHITDPDNFIYIHIVMAADLSQLIANAMLLL